MSLKQWWTEREPRERTMVLIGAFVIFTAAIYSFGYKPASTQLKQLRTDTTNERQTHDYLQIAGQQIQALGGAQQLKVKAEDLSLTRFIRQIINTTPLQNAVYKLDAEGEDATHLSTQDVRFEPLMQFLNQLQKLAGVRVDKAELREGKTAGLVSGELRLIRLR